MGEKNTSYLHRTADKAVQDQGPGATEGLTLKLVSEDALGIHWTVNETFQALDAMVTSLVFPKANFGF